MAGWRWGALALAALAMLTSSARANPPNVSADIPEDGISVWTFTASGPVIAGDTPLGPIESRWSQVTEGNGIGDTILQTLPDGAPYRTPSGSALNVKSCDNGRFTISLIGDLARDLCPIFGRYASSSTTDRIVTVNPVPMEDEWGGVFYQSGANWVQIGFMQTFTTASGERVEIVNDYSASAVGDPDGSLKLSFPRMAPLLDAKTKNQLWPAAGGIARYTDTQRILLPPGLPIVAADGRCVRLPKTTSLSSRLSILAAGSPLPSQAKIDASFREFGCGPQTPMWVKVLVIVGIPLALIVGIVWWIARRIGRWRSKRELRSIEQKRSIRQADAGDADPQLQERRGADASGKQRDRVLGLGPVRATWFAQSKAKRYTIIAGLALGLLLLVWFAITGNDGQPPRVLVGPDGLAPRFRARSDSGAPAAAPGLQHIVFFSTPNAEGLGFADGANVTQGALVCDSGEKQPQMRVWMLGSDNGPLGNLALKIDVVTYTPSSQKSTVGSDNLTYLSGLIEPDQATLGTLKIARRLELVSSQRTLTVSAMGHENELLKVVNQCRPHVLK